MDTQTQTDRQTGRQTDRQTERHKVTGVTDHCTHTSATVGMGNEWLITVQG